MTWPGSAPPCKPSASTWGGRADALHPGEGTQSRQHRHRGDGGSGSRPRGRPAVTHCRRGNPQKIWTRRHGPLAVSYTHLRAHETVLDLVCRLLLEKKKNKKK